ncbi:MAG: hypothetical protein R3E66_02045 [bacterium]
MITVRPVLSKADTRLFLRVPELIYKADPSRRYRDVRHLLRRSDYSAQGQVAHYLAESNGQVSGRITVHTHPDRRKGAFGLLDCQDDGVTMTALLSAAEDWLKARGVTTAIGPVDPSALFLGGVLSSPAPNAEQMPASPEWLADRLVEVGWEPARSYQTWEFGERVPKQVRLISNAVQQNPGLEVVTMAQWLRTAPTDGTADSKFLEMITELYNRSYEGTYGFVPTSARDLGACIGYPARLDPRTTLIALHNAQPVAFAVTMAERTLLGELPFGSLGPTVRRLLAERIHKPESLRLALFGVLPEFRGSKLGGLSLHMYVKLVHAMHLHGMGTGVLTWTPAQDEITAAGLSLVGAKPLHTYDFYKRTWA